MKIPIDKVGTVRRRFVPRGMGIVCLWGFVALLATVGCRKTTPENLSTHTLVFGGDFFFGTRTNQALYSKKHWQHILGDVGPLIETADIAFINAEGVISGGGLPTQKSDRDPLYYRAHPNGAPMLAAAGIDLVTIGNNHAGDYGTDAVVEMMDRLLASGVQYTGGGVDLRDAKTPTVFAVGDTGVAVVGADLTYEREAAAGPARPGTLYFDFKDGPDHIIETLSQILEDVRKQANVVLFSPHWGHNWQKAPPKQIRRIAKAIIDAGYDGILGHSAHLIQGVELIDGKPVIYDTGNFVLSYGLPNDYDEHQSLLYRIEFNKAGITRLEAHPLHLGKVETRLARKAERHEILRLLKERSEAFGTTVTIEAGKGIIVCDPGAIEGAKKPAARLKKPPNSIRNAPRHLLLETLPEDATPTDVRFERGIRMVGYRNLKKTLSSPKAAQFIETFWTTDQPQQKNILIHMEAVGADRKTGKTKTRFAGHQAGDWVLPTSDWPAGKVVRDITYFRLQLKPDMPIKFYTGLYDGAFVPVVESDVPTEGGRVFLGESVQRKGGPRVYELLEQLKKQLLSHP